MRSLALLSVILLSVGPSRAQSRAAASQPNEPQLTRSAESFIRNLFTWGPDYKIKLGPLGPSPARDFYSVPVEVTYKGQTDGATFYISKDGKSFIRGEMFDTAADPFASNRAKLHLQGEPSTGPADAAITIVEFADFECPHCREVHAALKTVEKNYPHVRIVYKDFPLSQIHPWAETAAIGARCAFQQSPPAFWKMHDLIFDSQDSISPENVFDQLTAYADQLGLNTEAFKVCMASPEAKRAVDANHQDGVALNVSSTPTLFINGRPLIGGDLNSIEQFIEFERARRPPQ
ncbi:MAG TPA: thioredoxin domain-containing protein [Candidatus Acidoferrales bacterium]|nr:thioredoxin domain-containing protein [Candidatus Acidoferrales bacterium]